MRYLLYQLGLLTGVLGAAVALAYSPIAARWGPGGTQSLWAAAWIVAAPAALAALPLSLALTWWRQHAPQVAFAGTAIRLLGVGALALIYESLARPALAPFLTSLLVLYLALLLAETILVVFLVGRVFPRRAPRTE